MRRDSSSSYRAVSVEDVWSLLGHVCFTTVSPPLGVGGCFLLPSMRFPLLVSQDLYDDDDDVQGKTKKSHRKMIRTASLTQVRTNQSCCLSRNTPVRPRAAVLTAGGFPLSRYSSISYSLSMKHDDDNYSDLTCVSLCFSVFCVVQQPNFKQKFVALLKRFKVSDEVRAQEKETAVR